MEHRTVPSTQTAVLMEDFKTTMGDQNYCILNALRQQAGVRAEAEQEEARTRQRQEAEEAVQRNQADGDGVQQGTLPLPQMDGVADPISSTPDSGSRAFRDEDDKDNNPYSQERHRMSRQPTRYGQPQGKADKCPSWKGHLKSPLSLPDRLITIYPKYRQTERSQISEQHNTLNFLSGHMPQRASPRRRPGPSQWKRTTRGFTSTTQTLGSLNYAHNLGGDKKY